ncbi:hypothetical protein [Nostoc sp.]|uniref:hypothetical protein n=1 Tax=Nostoc sp. TaxID=1180 RepID=UPI002FF6A553
MTPKVETLAKLYLEGESVELSDLDQQELCDWLMGEFQQLPINPMFSDYMRYRTAAEMCADIAQERLWVSAESYDSEIYPNPFYGFAFLAIHDYYHCVANADFSLQGEITACGQPFKSPCSKFTANGRSPLCNRQPEKRRLKPLVFLDVK